MIPRLGDGNHIVFFSILQLKDSLENDSPSRGRKPLLNFLAIGVIPSLENDSPSRGRKLSC